MNFKIKNLIKELIYVKIWIFIYWPITIYTSSYTIIHPTIYMKRSYKFNLKTYGSVWGYKSIIISTWIWLYCYNLHKFLSNVCKQKYLLY